MKLYQTLSTILILAIIASSQPGYAGAPSGRATNTQVEEPQASSPPVFTVVSTQSIEPQAPVEEPAPVVAEVSAPVVVEEPQDRSEIPAVPQAVRKSFVRRMLEGVRFLSGLGVVGSCAAIFAHGWKDRSDSVALYDETQEKVDQLKAQGFEKIDNSSAWYPEQAVQVDGKSIESMTDYVTWAQNNKNYTVIPYRFNKNGQVVAPNTGELFWTLTPWRSAPEDASNSSISVLINNNDPNDYQYIYTHGKNSENGYVKSIVGGGDFPCYGRRSDSAKQWLGISGIAGALFARVTAQLGWNYTSLAQTSPTESSLFKKGIKTILGLVIGGIGALGAYSFYDADAYPLVKSGINIPEWEMGIPEMYAKSLRGSMSLFCLSQACIMFHDLWFSRKA